MHKQFVKTCNAAVVQISIAIKKNGLALQKGAERAQNTFPKTFN